MLVKIEAGEGRPILALMLINMATGVANCLVLSAAFALFFQRFAAEQLAVVYVVNAGVIVAGSALFLWLTRRFAVGASLTGLSASLAVLVWIAAILLMRGAPAWLIFALPILFQTIFVLGNLVIWSLAGRLFDVRQGRRLFGLINTGYWIGVVTIGIAVRFLVPHTGLAGLLPPAAVAATLASIGMLLVTRRYTTRIGGATAQGAKDRTPLSRVLKDSHALLVFATTACVWLAFYVIDNIFYERAHAVYASAADLAGFLGFYNALGGVITIAITAIGSGVLIQALGVPRSLLVTPAILVLLCVAMLGCGLSAGEGFLLFILAAATRLIDVAAMGAVNQPSLNLTYQPLPASLKMSVQTIAEGIMQPLAIGLAGLLLLALRQGLDLSSTQLAIVALVIVALWCLWATRLGASYRKRFAALLKARAYDSNAETRLPIDKAAVAILSETARTGEPAAALYAIETLLQQAPMALLSALPELARNPSNEVRLAIVPHVAAVEPDLLRAMTDDPSPDVRAAALRALAEANGQRHPSVEAALHSSDLALRQAALSGLAARHDATMFVRQEVRAWLRSGEPTARRAALQVAGILRDATLWPEVAALLDAPGLRGAAMRALSQGGDDAGCAVAAVAINPQTPVPARASACAVLGRLGNAAAHDALGQMLDDPECAIRDAALEAFTRLRFVEIDARRPALIARELDDIAAMSGLADSDAVVTALLAAKRRLLLLLSLGHDPAAMQRAIPLLLAPLGDADRNRAAALELVEMWSPQHLRARILALFGKAAESVDQPTGATARALVQDAPRWATSWVMAWALTQLPRSDDATLRGIVQPMAMATDPALRDAARRWLGNSTTETSMVSVVERVLLLKSSNFFAGVSDSLLAGIAASLEEVPVTSGAMVVSEGAIDQSMYVIARGRMEARHNDASLSTMEAGEVFGELALLDPAPRSATVVALEDGLLLKLAGPVFQDLLADHGEMALAIIRELVQRLRATTARM
ncbi:MAG TPA: cyclic nucleotide-binding domain-containing protein [Dongiaceae bacterium]|nr:cyclic nucleotide-binding domain-containing protein [Dongiaceae bacterium]